MKTAYMVIVWAVLDNGETEFKSFNYGNNKQMAEKSADELRTVLGKCKFTVEHYGVEIVEVEA